MTIRKRLYLSNILMIAVPVCIAALIAAGCIAAIWYAVRFGGGIGFRDQEDFYQLSAGIAELTEHSLESGDPQSALDRVSALLDQNSLSLIIEQDGVQKYAYGETDPNDKAFIQAAKALGGEAYISGRTRGLYVHPTCIAGKDYWIYLFNSARPVSYDSLKVVAVLPILVLLLSIFGAILLTNRFLIRFVFRKIQQPLDLLAAGVHQIRDGNLEFRIEYGERDEFSPICADFNEMAQRLQQSVEQTLRNEESRKELLAGVSHDLRSPLTSIKAYVEGLLDGVAQTPQAQRRYLEIIRAKAGEIDQMISQIFFFSKIEMEEYPLNLKKLRLDEEIRSFLETVGPEYRGKGLEVTMTAVPAAVRADAGLLRRILSNILDNSAKYKNKEKGHLLIRLEDPGKDCLLTLSDDGPGVPAEALPKLFDVFYRSDPSRKNPHQGSGLGLAIVQSICQAHHAAIRAESGQDGTTFRVEIRKEQGEHHGN